MALSSSVLRTRTLLMSSHAGAASAPVAPIRNDVASSEVGPANPADTAAANATEIATAIVCVRIRSRRGSTTSVSVPAGKVRRKSGKVVATWTAETSLGLGLRLVIVQAEPVSNIANPTLESEVATRMTMKAELPSRPQRGSALDGVFGSRFTSVVKLSFVLAFEDVDPRLTVPSNIQHYLPRTVDAVLDHRLRQATSCHGP